VRIELRRKLAKSISGPDGAGADLWLSGNSWQRNCNGYYAGRGNWE
jgi:hypothetical protein